MIQTPDDLAAQLSVSAGRVRQMLRHLYPDAAPGPGGRWRITEEQARALVAAVVESPPLFRKGPGRVSTRDLTVPTDWFWEGNVQGRVAEHLAVTGWEVLKMADTLRQERGPDITARRGRRRLLVEVKGYPSESYRDSRRAGQIKRTSPGNQAPNWIARATYTAVAYLGEYPGHDVAIGLPDFPRMRNLATPVEGGLASLGIGLYWVRSDGGVHEALAPRNRFGTR
jgi:hypothetical protein